MDVRRKPLGHVIWLIMGERETCVLYFYPLFLPFATAMAAHHDSLLVSLLNWNTTAGYQLKWIA